MNGYGDTMEPLYACGPRKRPSITSKVALDKDDPLVAGVRHKLQVLLDDEKFSVHTLGLIAGLANSAERMFGQLDPKKLTIDEDGLPPPVDTMDNESFGASVLRTTMESIKNITNQPSVADVIRSISQANDAGLPEVAEALKQKLRDEYGIPLPKTPKPPPEPSEPELDVTPLSLPAPPMFECDLCRDTGRHLTPSGAQACSCPAGDEVARKAEVAQ